MKSESAPVKIDQKAKYSQKFCERWMNIFSPWLTRCEDDPNKPFCRACQCRLDCNRCHLHRHERTSKHIRNLEILVHKGESAARYNLSIRQERSKYYKQRTNAERIDKMSVDSDLNLNSENENDNDNENEDANENEDEECIITNNIQQTTNQPIKFEYEEVSDDNFVVKEATEIEATEIEATEIKDNVQITQLNEEGHKGTKSRVESQKNNLTMRGKQETPVRKEAANMFKKIHKDKNELIYSFKELVNETLASPTPVKDKNHVDLFFESVSSSVKALSPKLIAEAKMRVSQLICELELRSLTESENQKIDIKTSF